MYKEFTLKKADGSEKNYGFLATGATAVRYKQVFREDLLIKMRQMKTDANGEPSPDADLGFVDKLAYIMNAAAEKKDMTHLNYDSFVEWLDEIEAGELFNYLSEITMMYMGNKATDSELKKSQDQQSVS